jgi:hypothetical protein
MIFVGAADYILSRRFFQVIFVIGTNAGIFSWGTFSAIFFVDKFWPLTYISAKQWISLRIV